MPNPFQIIKVAEAVIADSPALSELSVRLLAHNGALHALITTATENASKTAVNIVHRILPELNIGELTAKLKEVVDAQKSTRVREPAQLLINRTEGVQS